VASRFGRRARAERRLRRIAVEVGELRRQVGVLEEQVGFLAGVEADAGVEAVVGGDPVTAREHRAATSDAARARRELADVRAALERLLAEQDRLLEAL
jgi:hypothetical protein